MDEIEFGGIDRPRSMRRTIAWSAALIVVLGALVTWHGRHAPWHHPWPAPSPAVVRAARISVDSGWSAVWDPKSPHRFMMNVRVDNGGDVPTHLSDYSVDRLSSMTVDRLWIAQFPIHSFDAVSASVVPTNYTLPAQASAFLIMSATLTCPPGKPVADPKIRLNQDGNRIQVDLPGADWLQDDADGVCRPT